MSKTKLVRWEVDQVQKERLHIGGRLDVLLLAYGDGRWRVLANTHTPLEMVATPRTLAAAKRAALRAARKLEGGK